MGRPENSEAKGLIKNAILIAGPTASGKSALALDLATSRRGVIVNTDSMQGYSVLDVVTARPNADEMALARHELYGHVPPSRAYSTGAWLRDVMALAKDGRFEGETPIFTGGTGLYFRALVEGLSEMPDVPQNVRDRWRYELKERGPDRLHRILRVEDPAAAQAIRATDGQRIVRALEVLEHSGRSILAWQAERGRPLIDRASVTFLCVEPERDALIRRIEKRFDRMIENGALEEVKTLISLDLDPALPAMKAIGVPELSAVLAGEMSATDAIERAKIATRQYAKRQTTWFRNQFGPEWRRLGLPLHGGGSRIPLPDAGT